MCICICICRYSELWNNNNNQTPNLPNTLTYILLTSKFRQLLSLTHTHPQ